MAVPDKRFDWLVDVYKPASSVPAFLTVSLTHQALFNCPPLYPIHCQTMHELFKMHSFNCDSFPPPRLQTLQVWFAVPQQEKALEMPSCLTSGPLMASTTLCASSKAPISHMLKVCGERGGERPTFGIIRHHLLTSTIHVQLLKILFIYRCY